MYLCDLNIIIFNYLCLDFILFLFYYTLPPINNKTNHIKQTKND